MSLTTEGNVGTHDRVYIVKYVEKNPQRSHHTINIIKVVINSTLRKIKMCKNTNHSNFLVDELSEKLLS